MKKNDIVLRLNSNSLDIKPWPGLYIISYTDKHTNITKRYIGTTNNVQRRYSEHNTIALKGTASRIDEVYSRSKTLYSLMGHFGIENFDFEIVSYFNSEVNFPNVINKNLKSWEPNRIGHNEELLIKHFKSDNIEFGFNESSGKEGSNSSKNLKLVEKESNIPWLVFDYTTLKPLYFNDYSEIKNYYKDYEENHYPMTLLQYTNPNYKDVFIELYNQELQLKDDNKKIKIVKKEKKKDTFLYEDVIVLLLKTIIESE